MKRKKQATRKQPIKSSVVKKRSVAKKATPKPGKSYVSPFGFKISSYMK
jgi:hypothetical protein